METVNKIHQWCYDRDIHLSDPKVQMCKTIEELGELAKSINKNDVKGQTDGIGDVVVCLIALSIQLGLNFNGCIEYAYNEIKDRKGKIVNGLYVKESYL